MTSSRVSRLVWTAVFLPALWAVAALASSEFPPITDAERALTQVRGYPGAPAVVLFEKADLRLRDYPREGSSVMTVHVRLKVLSEEGKHHGEVSIPHSAFFRLGKLEGRTVQADGTALPLAKDAVFEERSSQSSKSFLTKAAFPAVEVGSIVEYRYVLRWDSLYYMKPWYFARPDVPTLRSEITYHKPANMTAIPYGRAPKSMRFQSNVSQGTRGSSIRIWMDNLPPIPDEPYRPPFEDLSSHYLLVPKEIYVDGERFSYFDSWKTVCRDFETVWYGKFGERARRAKREAKLLVSASGARSKRDAAAALYSFVRDVIRTVDGLGVFVDPESNADKVFRERRGASTEKALLLMAMLEVVKIKPRLVWAVDRSAGRPDLAVANPWWFDTALVRLDLDGEVLYLDPSDRSLAFGRLAPGLEGTRAIVHDRKMPVEVTLPERPFDDNLRRAEIALVLDEEGRLTGTGSLHVTGHHARSHLLLKDGAEATAETWQEWVENAFEGYYVGDVEVEEKLEEQDIQVSWSLAQREEEILGDETSLDPSRPLGPVKQPFSLPAARRKTAVQLSFADRNEVLLSVSWPESWELDLVPEAFRFRGDVGAVESIVEVDESAGHLTVKRRFDVTTHRLGRELYATIRNLYAQAEKSDAQRLVLVRR